MANPVQFKLDTRQFDAAMRLYRQYSKRSVPEIVNTKAFFIARRAVVETIKADKAKIRAFFSGRNRTTGERVGRIINFRRGKRGERGLYGDAMLEASAMMRASRLRSIGYIKSGWLWVIKSLEPYVKSKRGAARSEAGRVKLYGQPKGKAFPAPPDRFFGKAIIQNFAAASHTTVKDPLGRFGGPGLQKAFDFEAGSMMEYVQNKLRKEAQNAGIKTN